MGITITAFEKSPDGGKGLARDTRVRWALEEAGLPYDVRLVSFQEMKEPAHLARHPFAQIPTYEEEGLTVFESGSIVFHIAQKSEELLPTDPHARARAITWMFAALNTVEPPILELQTALFAEGSKPWKEDRLLLVKDRIRTRLEQLSSSLGQADWLDGEFSAGDLLMVSVLLRLRMSGTWTSSPIWPPTSLAVKPDQHISVRLPHSWLSTHLRDPDDRGCGASLEAPSAEVSSSITRGRQCTRQTAD